MGQSMGKGEGKGNGKGMGKGKVLAGFGYGGFVLSYFFNLLL